MRRQGGCEIRLALDRVNRVVLAAHDERRAPDAVQIWEQVECLALAAWFCEPTQHLRPANGSQCRLFPHGGAGPPQPRTLDVEEQPHAVDDRMHGQISLVNWRSIHLAKPLACFERNT